MLSSFFVYEKQPLVLDYLFDKQGWINLEDIERDLNLTTKELVDILDLLDTHDVVEKDIIHGEDDLTFVCRLNEDSLLVRDLESLKSSCSEVDYNVTKDELLKMLSSDDTPKNFGEEDEEFMKEFGSKISEDMFRFLALMALLKTMR